MEFIKPNAIYFDEYLAACKESHDNNITEWMPVELDDFDGWKERALRLYDMLESGDGLLVGIQRMITYWCIEHNKFVGEVQIRPYVSVDEAKAVGHIGYAVRHSMWGKSFPCDTIMTKPHSTVLDKNWLAWKKKSERNG